MTWNLNTVALLVPLLFLLIGLTITVAIDPYISRKHRRVMGVIIVLSFTLIAQNIGEDYLAAGEPQWFLRTTLAVYGDTLRPVFLILFLYIVRPEKKFLGCWALAILNWAIHMTAYFSHLCFWISESNHYEGGPLSNTCLVISSEFYYIWLHMRFVQNHEDDLKALGLLHDAIAAAESDAGIVNGVGGGCLSPWTDAGRAQVATTLMRFHATVAFAGTMG